MHRDAQTLRSAPFQILAIPCLDHLSLFCFSFRALTLHVNNNTVRNVVHAFRVRRALQLEALLYNKPCHCAEGPEKFR